MLIVPRSVLVLVLVLVAGALGSALRNKRRAAESNRMGGWKRRVEAKGVPVRRKGGATKGGWGPPLRVSPAVSVSAAAAAPLVGT